VTGAGSGIGRAVSQALHHDGFTVFLAGRRLQELERTAGCDPRMIPVVTDVAQADSVRALFHQVRERCGRLDLLFNNAGVSAQGLPFEDIPLEQWNAVVSVNLTGAFLCAQEAVRLMKSQDPQGGRIVNNGSISAYSPRPNSAPYTATKHAVTGLTKSISLDCRPYRIACGQIDIGNAATEMTARMTEGALQANGTMVPEPRIDLQHIADAVVYMANLPLDANVQFMTLMATTMPYVGRG
jgi:NAD(P)-dependent dehydrogenase (short-subunit alcohol dehydrogenase family)